MDKEKNIIPGQQNFYFEDYQFSEDITKSNFENIS